MRKKLPIRILTHRHEAWAPFFELADFHGFNCSIVADRREIEADLNAHPLPIWIIDGQGFELEGFGQRTDDTRHRSLLVNVHDSIAHPTEELINAGFRPVSVVDGAGDLDKTVASLLLADLAQQRDSLVPALPRAELALLRKIARLRVGVLVTGESGVGKEVVAHFLHEGRCAEAPYVAVNCAALPSDLFEAELFGVAKGAYTGAYAARPGKFEIARNGTLFLDEVGELSLAHQAKLLRVLQEREFTRVGEHRPRPVECRMIFATNRDLLAMVQKGTFREDLYHRLAVFPFHVPALRDRPDQIPHLVGQCLRDIARETQTQTRWLSESAMQCFVCHPWRGNVRELRHTLMRVAVLHEGDGCIQLSELPEEMRMGTSLSQSAPSIPIPAQGVDLPQLLADFELQVTLEALKQTDGNKTRAAKLLGIKRTTLIEKLKRIRAEGSDHREADVLATEHQVTQSSSVAN